MTLYRISKLKYTDHLSGEGSFRVGGRWNSPGTRVVYTSTSRALAMVEMFVHITHNMIPNDLVMLTIELDDSIDIPQVGPQTLPVGWNDIHDKGTVRTLGDKFIGEQQYLAISVPSAVVMGDFNVLINPKHKDFDKVKVKSFDPFFMDERMFV